MSDRSTHWPTNNIFNTHGSFEWSYIVIFHDLKKKYIKGSRWRINIRSVLSALLIRIQYILKEYFSINLLIITNFIISLIILPLLGWWSMPAVKIIRSFSDKLNGLVVVPIKLITIWQVIKITMVYNNNYRVIYDLIIHWIIVCLKRF